MLSQSQELLKTVLAVNFVITFSSVFLKKFLRFFPHIDCIILFSEKLPIKMFAGELVKQRK